MLKLFYFTIIFLTLKYTHAYVRNGPKQVLGYPDDRSWQPSTQFNQEFLEVHVTTVDFT